LKKLGILHGTLISHLLITLVPLCVFLYASLFAITNAYQQHIIDVRAAALQHTSVMLDQRIRECKNLANQITQDPFIGRRQLQEAYTGSLAIRELGSMEKANEFLIEIGVYYYGDDYMYLGRGATELRVACAKSFYLSEDDTERFMTLLTQTTAPRLLYMPSRPALFYLIPLPTSSAHSYGVALFLFDNTTLPAFFTRDSLASSDIQIWAYETGETLYTTPVSQMPDVAIADVLTGTDWISLPDGRYRVLRAPSQAEPGLFLAMLLHDSSVRPLPEGFSLLILAFAGVLVVGLSLATLFTSRYWKSMRELGSLVIPSMDRSTHWEAIQTALRATLSTNTELNRQLKEHLVVLRENLLLRLVEGEASSTDSIASYMETVGLDATLRYGAILSVRLSSAPSTLPAQVLHWVAKHHSRDCCAMEVGGVNCVIVAQFFNEAEGQESARQTALALAQMLEESVGGSIFIGIGRVTPVHELRWSYLQSVAMLEREAPAGMHIVDFGEAKHSTGNATDFSEKEMILTVAVQQGDAALVEQITRSAVAEACQKATSEYHFTCVSLVYWALDLAKDEETRAALGRLTSLLDRIKPSEFEDRLVDALRTLCQEYRVRNEKQDDEYTQGVLHRVAQSFTNPNLSLEMLSDTFGSSTAYWSRFFKDRVGENFSDYVWRLRLDLAKQLLRGTEFPVNEVVERIGYSDARSFIRKFKVSEGITPGQYRKTIQ
jgi:AraC-like DNA-binding protein